MSIMLNFWCRLSILNARAICGALMASSYFKNNTCYVTKRRRYNKPDRLLPPGNFSSLKRKMIPKEVLRSTLQLHLVILYANPVCLPYSPCIQSRRDFWLVSKIFGVSRDPRPLLSYQLPKSPIWLYWRGGGSWRSSLIRRQESAFLDGFDHEF